MTDASGVVVWAADYKPFGEVTITVSTITNNLRFPGQYFDQETGLLYNYFRDLNPSTGTYIESDPIGILPNGPRGGLNHLYTYVGNNAVNVADLLGLIPGVPGNPITPGQFPNMANICNLGNGMRRFSDAMSPSNQAWCAEREEEKRIRCNDQVEYLVVYRRYPLTFLGITPASMRIYADPVTMDVRRTTLTGKMGCQCQ